MLSLRSELRRDIQNNPVWQLSPEGRRKCITEINMYAEHNDIFQIVPVKRAFVLRFLPTIKKIP